MLKGRQRDIEQAQLRREILPSWQLKGLECSSGVKQITKWVRLASWSVWGKQRCARIIKRRKQPFNLHWEGTMAIPAPPGLTTFKVTRNPTAREFSRFENVDDLIKKTTSIDPSHVHRQCLTYRLPFCQLWPGDFQINQPSYMHSFIIYQELCKSFCSYALSIGKWCPSCCTWIFRTKRAR